MKADAEAVAQVEDARANARADRLEEQLRAKGQAESEVDVSGLTSYFFVEIQRYFSCRWFTLAQHYSKDTSSRILLFIALC